MPSMKRIKLSEAEKEALEYRHQHCSTAKESDRIKAVLLRSEGWTVPMIAQALRLHQTTITRHINEYREGKLESSSGGSESHLTHKQTQALILHLESHLHHHVHEIIEYVQSTCGVTYSVPGMNHWLHRNGFSYKKPKGHPYKSDKVAQAKFIEEYKQVKSSLKKDDSLLFIDSVHPTQETKISYGWIRKGKTKKVGTTASRTRVNIVGALNIEEIEHTITEQYDWINADNLCLFLTKIRKIHGKKGTIYLVHDLAGYHRAQVFKDKAEELNIKLLPLPAYSPNLNPIERLWKVMNETVRNHRLFKSAKDFRSSLTNFFKEILPMIGSSLTSRINDNFHIG